MTLEETRKILSILRITYPQTFNNWTREQSELYLQLWSNDFKDMPFEIVNAAISTIRKTSTSAFAPTIGQVTSAIKEIVTPNGDMEAINAWEELRKFIRRMSRDKQNDMQEYTALNKVTRLLYDYNFVLSMSYMESSQIEYRRNEFLRMFKERSEKMNLEAIQSGDFVALSDNGQKFKSLGFSQCPVKHTEAIGNVPKRDVSQLVARSCESF